MNQQTGRPSSLLEPIALLLIAMVSIQSGASLAKTLFPVIGAAGTTALRLALASVLMLAILRPWRAPFSVSSLRMIVLYGVALGAMNLLFYMAINRIPLGIGVALEFTGPLAVAMYHSRRLADFVWIALAVTGLALLIPMDPTESLDMLGVIYALGAGVCWGAYIVFGQKAGAQHGVQTSAWGVLIAALCVAPIGITDAGSALFDPALIPAAIGLAILSTALPLSLEMIAMTRVPARTFGTLMSMEPAIGALSGLIFLQEHLSLMQWLAILAIIAASAGATLTSRSPQPVLVCPD